MDAFTTTRESGGFRGRGRWVSGLHAENGVSAVPGLQGTHPGYVGGKA